MLDKLVDALTASVTRRGFVGRAAMAVAALTASLVFGPTEAQAGVTYACCGPCLTSTCPCSGCYRSLYWTCCTRQLVRYQCLECYGSHTTCSSTCFCCSDVICSCAARIGTCG